jgi:outer membrane protein assembly factor BamB
LALNVLLENRQRRPAATDDTVRSAPENRLSIYPPYDRYRNGQTRLDQDDGPAAHGGALATADNLVFFGEADGNFNALYAQTGEKLWHYNLGAGVNAPPVTYEVNGVQYIAVAAGGNFQMSYPLGDAIAIVKLGT